ncbi:hypothetical protein P171DRAFT_120956 [Karstenula rhodostoma CBS 690.94]|uniref:Uncharacterized protein n=1 Tax=Karstenula rhodostoma CBS 690.94 TaxID=1392251 RepID=A0A9P4U5R9_9PLEO|nr:hypothetical protein P171DRAFT_120956 [Karstenula rhodostoma CBS 690.94]
MASRSHCGWNRQDKKRTGDIKRGKRDLAVGKRMGDDSGKTCVWGLSWLNGATGEQRATWEGGEVQTDGTQTNSQRSTKSAQAHAGGRNSSEASHWQSRDHTGMNLGDEAWPVAIGATSRRLGGAWNERTGRPGSGCLACTAWGHWPCPTLGVSCMVPASSWSWIVMQRSWSPRNGL